MELAAPKTKAFRGEASNYKTGDSAGTRHKPGTSSGFRKCFDKTTVSKPAGLYVGCSAAHSSVDAIFSFRYDAHLVPDLVENLRPIVDGFVAYDDRGAAELYTDERVRKAALLEAARDMGARWVFCVDPDERLEDATSTLMPTMTKDNEPIIWKFRLREMYSSQTYRIDGIWGKKKIACLFPLLEGQVFSDALLHGSRCPLNPDYEKRNSGLNIYHLKMITAERRLARRELYKTLDPRSTYQKIGYDYLGDDAGLVLKKVSSSRRYSPVHREPGGLWQPDPRLLSLKRWPLSNGPSVELSSINVR